VIIAVGGNAASMMDPALQAGFQEHITDLEVSFAGCADRDAVELRMVHRVDLALLGGSLSTREQGAGLRQTKLGLELFALAVAPDFPLESISSSQMRQVLSGQVREWQQLGCDRGAVVVVVPSRKPLANRAARELIRGDSFSANAIRVADDQHVADQILRNPGAIAVVRVLSAPRVGMKLLQIDWTPPTPEAFAYDNYPYGVPLHVVYSGQPDEFTQRFLDYAGSEAGREILGRTLLLP
jgi:phosphate transport system substrate-binding protein